MKSIETNNLCSRPTEGFVSLVNFVFIFYCVFHLVGLLQLLHFCEQNIIHLQ